MKDSIFLRILYEKIGLGPLKCLKSRGPLTPIKTPLGLKNSNFFYLLNDYTSIINGFT